MSTDRNLKYANYDEVIFYRKKWVWALFLLFLTPVAVIIGLTGDVYTAKNGQLDVIPKSVRLIASIGFSIVILINVVGPMIVHR